MSLQPQAALSDCDAPRPRCHPDRSQRLFSCRRCDTRATICTACDRGQQYCSAACRQQQRALQVRQAGQRYQLRDQGRILHAARQRAYQARRKVPGASQPQPQRIASEGFYRPPRQLTGPRSHHGCPAARHRPQRACPAQSPAAAAAGAGAT